jgi:hypothetical protein
VPAFGIERRLSTTAFGSGRNRVVWLVTSKGHGDAHERDVAQFVDVAEGRARQVLTPELGPEELTRWIGETNTR